MKRGRRTGWLALALAVQMMLVIWAVDPASLDVSSDPAVVVPAAKTPNAAPVDIERGAVISLEYARAWSPDVRLISAVMRLEWPVDGGDPDEIAVPNGGWLVFTYTDGESTLSIYLDRRTGVPITSVTSRFGDPDLPEIDLATYVRASTTAAMTAEVLHGAAYRSACPGTRSVALVTPSRADDGSGEIIPIWTVTYADSRFPGDYDVLVSLNALTGSVITSEQAERPCGGE